MPGVGFIRPAGGGGAGGGSVLQSQELQAA